METEPVNADNMDFTDAELDVSSDFTDALLARKNPDVEEYLARCPGSEAKMRPLLDTALLLDREITQFRRRHPHVDLGKLLDRKHKTVTRPK